MSGFGSAVRLFTALLRARLLPRFVVAATLGTALLASFASSAKPGDGFAALAAVADLVVILVLTFGAVLGAVTIAQDATSTALRAILIRPVGRTTILLAHAVVLSAFLLALYVLSVGLAAPIIGAHVGFGDVRLEEFVITPKAAMSSLALRLLLLPIPGLLVAPLLGLAVSVLVDDVAAAVVAALGLTTGPVVYGRLIGDLPAGTWLYRALHPLEILAALATGDTTRETLVASTAYAVEATLIPFAWGAGLLALALAIFSRREIRG